jgi:hypothetical protein
MLVRENKVTRYCEGPYSGSLANKKRKLEYASGVVEAPDDIQAPTLTVETESQPGGSDF